MALALAFCFLDSGSLLPNDFGRALSHTGFAFMSAPLFGGRHYHTHASMRKIHAQSVVILKETAYASKFVERHIC